MKNESLDDFTNDEIIEKKLDIDNYLSDNLSSSSLEKLFKEEGISESNKRIFEEDKISTIGNCSIDCLSKRSLSLQTIEEKIKLEKKEIEKKTKLRIKEFLHKIFSSRKNEKSQKDNTIDEIKTELDTYLEN
ncbi:hypothetical protein [Candidatus Phytoplasma pini]|uniref:Uncharacterized protein n=1 Tax=Candidatus Phytoplasma pini TaxID=267362 RepID=A0A559KJ73_9MOLU|nr:hypothetical protein [Candidatus Phytoplasma pini]TVY12182.1 hypothetical protein MDPP_00304 [Candidatus Phytoplasma pini]